MIPDFRVGVTSDFLTPEGKSGFGDIGLEELDRQQIPWEYFSSPNGVISAEAANRYDAMLVLGPKVDSSTLTTSVDSPCRLRVVARFGVGYDSIDVTSCDRAGVVLTITPEGVRRPVAVAALTFILSLTHKLLIKDQLTRAGRWSEKLNYIGQGVTRRTLGIIGFGNIGQELAKIAKPLDMQMISYDPRFREDVGALLGVKSVPLDELLRQSDYVVVCCALTEQTKHLIGPAQLAQMKPNAYLINVARGPIVDQVALTEALVNERIAGAGLDVFEEEPIDPKDPILSLPNTIVAPHAICWTDECFRLNGQSAIQSIIDVGYERRPKNIVNLKALEHDRWKPK
jgi:phosphoglycerate dehydrogenase-like enzyme